MQINHGAVDLCVAEKFLDGVQMCPGLQQVRGKAVAQRVHGSGGKVEFFPSDDDQALQRTAGHGTGGLAHSLGQRFEVMIAATHVGKEQKWVSMKSPVATQLLIHRCGQGNHPVFITFTVADEQFVFLAPDVVNGQAQAFA